MSASDCLRNFCGRYDGIRIDNVGYNELRTIADHIDAEMVELPKDADGVPIHVGDTVYTEDGNMGDVIGIYFIQHKENVVCTLSDGSNIVCASHELSHEMPDSLERIADEIGKLSTNPRGISGPTLKEWADRIRKLAEREDER